MIKMEASKTHVEDGDDDFHDDENLRVMKIEAARGMLKQPKSKSDTERLMMKIAVVFLT